MKNIQLRGITGLFYIFFMIFSAILGGLYLYTLYFIFLLLCTYEFHQIFKLKYPEFQAFPLYIANILLYVSSIFVQRNPEMLSILWFLALIPFIFLFFSLYQKTPDALILAAIGIFGCLYIGFGLSSLVLLSYSSSNYEPIYLLFIYLSIWSNDSFAYLIGRKIGKTKLFPRISPNKTWEGALGGVLGSMLFLGIFYVIFYYLLKNGADKMSIKDFIPFFCLNFFISILANFGDLFESMVKRFVGVKDSSNLLPGHGGFLDRLDSLLFVGPFLYVLIHLIQR